jgi:hypothetical protein
MIWAPTFEDFRALARKKHAWNGTALNASELSELGLELAVKLGRRRQGYVLRRLAP